MHDPVPDHGISRSRLLTNHDEFTTIAFYSLRYGVLDMGYAVYTVSLVVYPELLQAEQADPALHTKRKLCLISFLTRLRLT